MSISSDFTEAGRFSGRETVRGGGGGGGLEKSNFSQTCSLLSQYLKENGSFRDLSLGMSRNIETGKSETFRQLPIRTVKSMDLFPEHAGFGVASSVPMETVTKKAEFSTTKEPETAQMTIFYAGKVYVFDNFTMEKAKEIMMLASKASSCNDKPNIVAAGNNLTQELLPQRIPQRIASDLPIARKASLHRFLEKRKDRINSRAPYQINQSSTSVASVPDKTVPVENKTWLGLAPQSTNPFKLQL